MATPEQITVPGTSHTAWHVGGGNWVTSWTGIAYYSQQQAREMVFYAELLETIGPRTFLSDDTLDNLAVYWGARLDRPVDDVRTELLHGHVTAFPSDPSLRGSGREVPCA